MARPSMLPLLVLLPLLGATGPGGCPWRSALYALAPGSSLTQGCFDPCLCPISIAQPVEGRFALIEFERDDAAPFREFVIPFVRWQATWGDREVPISGSGRYRVGGEFAQTQQLELDLQIGDGPVQHFDSGLVPGGGEFPKLDVTISVNGGFCYDTVIDVVAAPLFSNL